MLLSLFRPVAVGRLFGIPVRVTPLVLVLLLLVLATASGKLQFLWLLYLMAVLGVSLIAHELGHALVARRLGMHVEDILILPHGGVARVESMVDRPDVEIPVALAGPAVNLALAGLCAVLPAPYGEPALVMNLTLGLGNLIPAFPLDGGRVLRAWLHRFVALSDATRAAVKVSMVLMLALLPVAYWYGYFWLGLILLLYVWRLGYHELMAIVTTTHRPPLLDTREVLRRAFRWPRAAPPRPSAGGGSGEAHAAPEQPKTEEAEPVDSELESFRGKLGEYFDRRRPR